MTNYHYPLYPIEERKDFRDLLDRTCEKYGNEESFFEKNGQDVYEGVTFNRFRNLVQALGEGLINVGFKKRDKIALIGKNCRDWAVSYLAITTIDCVVVPIDKEIKEQEIENILVKAQAKGFIYDNAYAGTVKSIARRAPFMSIFIPFEAEDGGSLSLPGLVKKGEELRSAGSKLYDSIVLDPKIVTSILFTSGTTGNPKGVMLSQFNILRNINGMRKLIWIDDHCRFLSVLPLHHAYECTCGFLCQIHAGSKIIYAQSLKKVGDNIREGKATNINVVPLLLENLYKKIKDGIYAQKAGKLKFALGLTICSVSEFFGNKGIRRKVFKAVHDKFGGDLDCLISGGAAVKPEVSNFLRNLGFRILQGYGISECSPFLAGNRDKAYKDDAAGLPLPEHDIKIMDPDSRGIGEIAAKGDSVMLGYYEEPELTAQAFRDGYFLTGDWGYIDREGFIHIAGRKKDVIVTKNGKNIYPEEVEALYVNSSAISEMIVREAVDPKTDNEIILAIIYPKLEELAEKTGRAVDSISDEEFVQQIRDEIKWNNVRRASYKRINAFTIVRSELPKTTTKKIKRHNVKEGKVRYQVY